MVIWKGESMVIMYSGFHEIFLNRQNYWKILNFKTNTKDFISKGHPFHFEITLFVNLHLHFMVEFSDIEYEYFLQTQTLPQPRSLVSSTTAGAPWDLSEPSPPVQASASLWAHRSGSIYCSRYWRMRSHRSRPRTSSNRFLFLKQSDVYIKMIENILKTQNLWYLRYWKPFSKYILF